MTRRGNNQGSIVKRADGRWMARISLPDGRRKCVYGQTRQETAQRMTAILRDCTVGLPVADERLTVERYLTEWLEVSARPSVRDSTFRSYSLHVRRHIVPRIGKLPLARLSPQHVQTMLNDLVATGMNVSTVLLIRATLRRALNQAVKWGRIPRNPATLVDPPKAKRHRFEPISAEEALAILDAVSEHRLAALWTLMLATGLRTGEALGLRWEDVDLNAGTLTVRQALQRLGGTLRFVEPKSETAKRTVPLAAFAQTALRAHRAAQNRERLLAANLWREHGLVFTTPLGMPLDPANTLKAFHRLLAAAGLPERRQHDLRHACATLLLAKGASMRVVMEILGHSQIGLTMNTYTHVLPNLMDEAIRGMDELFGQRAR